MPKISEIPTTSRIYRVESFTVKVPAFTSEQLLALFIKYFVTYSEVPELDGNTDAITINHHKSGHPTQIDQLSDLYTDQINTLIGFYQNAAQIGNIYQFKEIISNIPDIENFPSLIDTLFEADSKLVFAGGPTDADQVIAYAFALSNITKMSDETFTELLMISHYCDHRKLPEQVYLSDAKSVVQTETLSVDQKS